ncbi:PREDICTED: lamina-associated polypeptide 2, isoforms beta/delta/epsilon/gamma-like [Cyprinodon variegatus]|uniref:lamina-associated polypeptide 2, isoforms beta/delta/epsilon/gamma-like n=1 Tax=Cyprinodon variegatus TaxID=28743 RepID=UPI000742612E|nr:PREDICTED: lamina-associated polypeptide 2, isoforms beta/delta/epsilon/gamma-like [Cyprinodon variegatus]
MSRVEDPAHLSKSRLRSDLVSHNVELPPAGSKKEVYLKLHLEHVDQGNAAGFSSDEDDQVLYAPGGDRVDTKIPDPTALSDKDLKDLLLKYGVKAGPIVASTRAVYEKKLRKLLQSDGNEGLNEAETAVLYSDSDEEGEENGDLEDEKESEEEKERINEALELNQKQCNEKNVQRRDYPYSQCFFLSSKLRPCPQENTAYHSKRNLGSALKSSEWTQAHRSQIPAGINKVSLKTNHAGLRSGHLQEPVKNILKDLIPEAKTTPTGIYVTPRRPIKGAAQRPILYGYPDTPVSPTTLERRDVERRLVPIYVQILVFFIVLYILYFISINV